MRPRSCVPLAAVAIAASSSCGGAPSPAAPAAPAAGTIAPVPPGSPAVLVHRVTPSRLLPELTGNRGVVATEDGTRRVLADRMRLLVRADGSMDRAAELLPPGSVQSVALPSRLGGGYLFHVNAGGGTEIWRAAGWLDKLVPLTRRNEVVSDIVPGFDRLYLRLSTGNRVLALDPRSGDPMGLGPLPVASSYGMLAFADGWRAVVDTDLRGPLTTFDAGATWRAVGLSERAQGVGVVEGNPAVLVPGGRYLIDPRGGVTWRSDHDGGPSKGPPDPEVGRDDERGEVRRSSPLGKRPLRAAVEDGWPDSATTAVVARSGALARVSLRDGRVIAVAEDAYGEPRASCHAVRLGLHDIGFLCGEREGPTTVYAYAPPLSMRPVLRFEKPRFVSASGNGALVIRGRCTDVPAPAPAAPESAPATDAGAPEPADPESKDAKAQPKSGTPEPPVKPASAPDPLADEADARWYCVRSPAGEMREIRVKGFDLGVERVVGLGDGRIAVVVPPRGGSSGALSVIAGSSTSTVPLEIPAEPRSAARELKRGMWLDGFEERAPGVLGGWIEAGGPFLGVTNTLDGKVKAGEVREDGGGGIFAGRFGVALGEGGRSFETADGGMTWAPFDLPERDDESVRAAPSRGCGPAGCSLPGWVRVGWGDAASADDMKQADSPKSPYVPFKMSPTIHYDCSLASTATAPLVEKKAEPALPVPRRYRGPVGALGAAPVKLRQHDTAWAPFRNVEAPALAPDEYGVDNGPSSNEPAQLRAYAWGRAGSDWTRSGRWLVRFDDRFDAGGGLRASAATTSIWSLQTEALDAIGNPHSYNSTNWRGTLDPSGKSLLAAGCRNATCSLYSVGDGQPVLPLRHAVSGSNVFVQPIATGGAVRVGETWFFIASLPSDVVALWRADLGVARQIGTYHRTSQRSNFDPPRLVRRAFGTGIGLLIGGAPEPGERSGTWFVLPVDPETGALGEAVALARRDFATTTLARCAPEQDGWTLDVTPDTTSNVELDNARAQMDSVELRVRLDPGRACVENLATKSGYFYALEPKGAAAAARAPAKPLTAPPARKGGSDEGALPMAATEKPTGRRWGLTCKVRR